MTGLRPDANSMREPALRSSRTARAAADVDAQPAQLRAFMRDAFHYAFLPTRRNLLHWASWAITLGIELALMIVLRSGHIYTWEQRLTRRFQDVPGKGLVFDVTSTLTNTLSLPFLVLFLVIVLIVFRLQHPGAAALLLLSFPLHVLAQFPKALIDRPRPSDAFAGIEGVGGFRSFPSGHSEYVVTFFGFLAYLIMLHLSDRRQRITVFVCWLALALGTGFGRVAEGRHWPLDVLASYVVGLGLLSGLIWLHSAFRRAHKKTSLKRP
jgi:membrane-associated phospholipid phosphatase